ncbi:hypothetical protein BV20DRAFT_1055129 [Pilatotrama ljubarskyi]|nr:hypothetical protein BV20DRAFT_1055129 [Pilatotrama ljubarskyi]
MASLLTNQSATPATTEGAIQAGATLPAIPSLDSSFGALLIGTCFGLMLYGLTVHQAYRYFRLYPTDTVFLRSLVTFALLLETAHSVCSMHVIYYYLVTNYANPGALLEDVWSLRTLTWLSGLAIVLAQGFYARRVYMIGQGWRFLVAAAVTLIIIELGFVIGGTFSGPHISAATVEGFILATIIEYRRVAWLVSVVYGITAPCDILLTGSLIWVLLKKRTGFKRTDALISVIIVYTVNTGLVTGIFSFITFLFALIMPDNLVYIGISFFGAKLYVTSVLAVLNSRRELNDGILNGFDCTSFDLEELPKLRTPSAFGASLQFGANSQAGAAKTATIDIHMTRVREETFDFERSLDGSMQEDSK